MRAGPAPVPRSGDGRTAADAMCRARRAPAPGASPRTHRARRGRTRVHALLGRGPDRRRRARRGRRVTATRRTQPRCRGRRGGPSRARRVDEDYRTAVPSVYAAGDVIGFPALASVSMEQGRVAVCNAFGFAYKRQVSDLLPYGIYTIPEVSCVGLGEDEAARRGRRGRRGARVLPRQRARTDHRRPRRHGEARLRSGLAAPDRLPLHRRARVRARARGAGDDHARGHRRDVHRDGLQPSDARRDIKYAAYDALAQLGPNDRHRATLVSASGVPVSIRA